ncbi:MAG: hypothetical protein JWQ19_31 [Subtercola sp.]|nr:hypothetical protein [Subtercola sp.]
MTAAQTAKEYNHPVADDSQTTPTTQVSVQPNGSFSLQSDTLPVRAEHGETWLQLDTNLRSSADGMWAPRVAASPVEFSEGGSNELAKVQVDSATWLTESWPLGPLPVPTINGSDATYPEVLPGVDLRLSATAAGMAEVLIVKTAQAAANPVLAQLKLSLSGATVTTGTGEALGVTPDDQPPADASDLARVRGTVSSSPVWWDSQVSTSTADAPAGAEEARPVAQQASGTDVTLNIGDIVSTENVTYPLYVDPGWSTGAQAYWFTDRAYPDTIYLNGNANSGGIQAVGYGGPSPNYLSHAFWQFDTAALSGKHILGASLNTYLAWSNSCTSSAIQAWLYGTGTDAPGFTWNQEPSAWNMLFDTESANFGSGCAAGQGMGFNAAQAVAAAAGGGWPNIQIGLRAANESDPTTRKHYATDASLTVDYNTTPSAPNTMSIASPPRGCAAGPDQVFVNGSQSNSISLRANTSDPDGHNLGTAFFLTNIDTGANPLAPLGWGFIGTPLGPEGMTTAVVPVSLPDGHYAWRAQSQDTIDWGAMSATCYFTVDNTAPALPVLHPTSPAPYTVGQPMSVQFTANPADHIATFAYWWTSDTSTAKNPPLPTLGAAPSCTRAPSAGVRYSCADGAGNSPLLTVAPRDEKSTLWVISFDAAGNASTTSAQPSTAGITITANPDTTNVTAAAGHQWPMESLTAFGDSIPDKNSTPGTGLSAQKFLRIGVGTNVTGTDHVLTTPATKHPVITLPGYLELDRYYNGVYDAAYSDGFAPPGYSFEAALGQYVPLASAHPGMQEFYSCALPGTGDMTTTRPDCEGTGVTGVGMGYLWPTAASLPSGVPVAPVYRCSVPVNGHHFDSATANCMGWTVDYVLGYFAAIAPTVTTNSNGATPAVLTPARALDTTRSFTVSTWVKLDAANLAMGNYTAMSENGSSTNANSAFYLQKANGGYWRFCVRTQTGTDVVDCAASATAAPAGKWVMVTGVWDSVNQEVRLLIGNNSAPSDATSVTTHVLPPGEVSATSALTVGSAMSDGSPDNQWDGEIDDPVAFQGVIDGSQLRSLALLHPIS